MHTYIKRRKLIQSINVEIIKLELFLKKERIKQNKELKKLAEGWIVSDIIPKNVTDYMPSYKTIKAVKLFIKNMPEIVFDYDPVIQIYDPNGWHHTYKHNEIFLLIPSLKTTFTVTEKGVGFFGPIKINPSLKGTEKRKMERFIIERSIEML